MEWFIGVGAVVLVAVLLVGLFHGPSQRGGHTPKPARNPARRRAAGHQAAVEHPPAVPHPPAVENRTGVDHAHPVEAPPDTVAYVLPPPRRRRSLGRRSGDRPGGRRS